MAYNHHEIICPTCQGRFLDFDHEDRLSPWRQHIKENPKHDFILREPNYTRDTLDSDECDICQMQTCANLQKVMNCPKCNEKRSFSYNFRIAHPFTDNNRIKMYCCLRCFSCQIQSNDGINFNEFKIK
jgi:hypothetical protein